ncbi:phospholipid carrier-dependent glycosyltransferase [bacterium]|nr:MAG: phospholipid carrier-dependent glycosyltransferase [bacterium]
MASQTESGPNNLQAEMAKAFKLQNLRDLLGVFILALVVRCIGFGWGLPNAGRWGSYHPDESTRQIVGAVVSVLRDGLNPHFFNYPSLCVYATSVIFTVMQVLGLTDQTVVPQYPWPLVHDIIVAGRVFSVLCGALTAVCVWGMAREVGLRRGAILSGVLVALCPGLVQHSHFATVDVPATFFVAACLWATLRAMNYPAQTKWWIWSAILAGLAAGTKYNAGLVIIAPLVALVVAQKGEAKPAKWLIPASIGLAALAFFVTTPYSLLSFSEFWGDADPKKESGFAFELLVHPRLGSGDIFEGTGLGWIYHLTFNLPFVLTWPLLIAGLGGIVWAAKDRRQWPLLAFALIYFLIIGGSNVRFMRYTFLLVPPLMVWAGITASRLPKPMIWAGILGLFALLGTGNVLNPMTDTDMRDRAVRSSGVSTVGLASLPWFGTPPYQPENFNAMPQYPHPVQVSVHKIGEPLPANLPDVFVMSEFDYREQLRLHPDGDVAKFINTLNQRYAKSFKYRPQHLLPGRDFAPHDYIYTHPEVLFWQSPNKAPNSP